MKKLYRVVAEFEYFVVANDDADAFLAARDSASDAFSDTWDPDLSVTEETDVKRVPKDWRQSYPYGEDDTERTCEQILAAQASEGSAT